MRRLFLVLAKLVGLFQLYWALGSLAQIGFAFTFFVAPGSSQGGQVLASLIGTTLYFALSFGTAWLLLARTEWLADRLGIQPEGQLGELDRHPMLLVGVKLIGVYVTAHALPSLARAVLESRQLWEGHMGPNAWSKIIPTALQVGIGLFLALKSDKVVEIITRKRETTEQPTSSCPANDGDSPQE